MKKAPHLVELSNIVLFTIIKLYEPMLHPNNHGLPTTTTPFGYNNTAHLGTNYFTSVKISNLIEILLSAI
jgi:hypothetical protein